MGAVHDRVIMLGFTWHEYRGLYTINKDRVDVLNTVAGGFFLQLQGVLVDSLFVSLSVLDAKATSGGHDQVSFEGMLAEVGSELDRNADLAKAARDLLADFHVVMKDIRAHRDKRIAHADAKVVLGQAKLDGVKWETLEAAVRLCFRFYNAVSTALGLGATAFNYPSIAGDSDAVLHALEGSQRYHALERWLWTGPFQTMSGLEVRDYIREHFVNVPWKTRRPNLIVHDALG